MGAATSARAFLVSPLASPLPTSSLPGPLPWTLLLSPSLFLMPPCPHEDDTLSGKVPSGSQVSLSVQLLPHPWSQHQASGSIMPMSFTTQRYPGLSVHLSLFIQLTAKRWVQ